MAANEQLGGIVNMGNTCYANSVLQAFRHCGKIPWIFETGKFNTLFSRDPSPKRKAQQGLATTFADVMTLLQKCKRGQSVRPADFWNKLHILIRDTQFEQFIQKRPHDSHEMYLCLLDVLHESISQNVAMKITRPPPVIETDRHCIKALETWKRDFEKMYSPLVDLFYGLTHIVVECQECHTKSHSWETFSTLKVHVSRTGTPTLDEMFQEEFKPEVIEGYACDTCAPKRQNATKTVSIWRLPYYPVIVLKRFSFDGSKIQTPIAPLPAGGQVMSFQKYFSKESPEYAVNTTYSLHSIVDHHGFAGGGHYTAQCKSVSDSKWHIFDDDSVHPLAGPQVGSSTYMLWFERAAAAAATPS
jgi:ubiquitin C-terminal hydrolase